MARDRDNTTAPAGVGGEPPTARCAASGASDTVAARASGASADRRRGARASSGSARASYTNGFPPDAAIGTMHAGERLEWVFGLGVEVPTTRRRVTCFTTEDVKAGASDEALRFPIVRGSGRSRYSVIGAAVVPAERLSSDLPRGSRAVLGFRLDESHRPSVSVYLPSTGDVVDDALELGYEAAFPKDARKAAAKAAGRAESASAELPAEAPAEAPVSEEPEAAQRPAAAEPAGKVFMEEPAPVVEPRVVEPSSQLTLLNGDSAPVVEPAPEPAPAPAPGAVDPPVERPAVVDASIEEVPPVADPPEPAPAPAENAIVAQPRAAQPPVHTPAAVPMAAPTRPHELTAWAPMAEPTSPPAPTAVPASTVESHAVRSRPSPGARTSAARGPVLPSGVPAARDRALPDSAPTPSARVSAGQGDARVREALDARQVGGSCGNATADYRSAACAGDAARVPLLDFAWTDERSSSTDRSVDTGAQAQAGTVKRPASGSGTGRSGTSPERLSPGGAGSEEPAVAAVRRAAAGAATHATHGPENGPVKLPPPEAGGAGPETPRDRRPPGGAGGGGRYVRRRVALAGALVCALAALAVGIVVFRGDPAGGVITTPPPAKQPVSQSEPKGEDARVLAIKAKLRAAAVLRGIPPEILYAIAYRESRWQQFDANGNALTSPDAGIGIMQVTSHGSWDVERLKTDIDYNIAAGADILLGKFRTKPKIGDGDPRCYENWFYAVWAYNGWTPNNPYPYIIWELVASGPEGWWKGVPVTPVSTWSLVNGLGVPVPTPLPASTWSPPSSGLTQGAQPGAQVGLAGAPSL